MANLHLFFDGDTTPGGWTLVSSFGNPFYHRFVRGYSVYGGTGGSVSHTHVSSLVSCSYPSTSYNLEWGHCLCISSCTHTHGAGTTAAANNIPASKSLKVIKCNSGIPATIPTGAIAIFDASVPSGWTRYSSYDDKFIYCDHTVNVSHGAETHLHGSFTIGPGIGRVDADTSMLGELNPAWGTHTHSVSASTSSVSNRPPYLSVILGRSNSDNDLPLGMIGMFDGIPSDWQVLSGSGGDFYEKFILPTATYGTTGGSAFHVHPNVSATTGTSSHNSLCTSGYDECGAANTHTHWITYSFSQKSNLPPYIDVIFAKNVPIYRNATDSCSSSEVTTSLWETTISDVCVLAKDEGEVVTVLGYTTITDTVTGTVTSLNVLRYCTVTDNCHLALEHVYQEDCHPAWDSGVGSDAFVQGLAELTVLDRAFHTEYADAQLGLGETVGRMTWRFSTAYDKTSSSNLTTLTSVLASEITKLEFTDILGMSNHFVDYAYGTSLNYIGALFSLSRKSDETDTNYRARIKTAPLIAGGTRSSLRTAISTVLGIDEELISIVDSYKGADGNYGHITIEFDVSDGTIKYDEATFITIVNRSKAAGIKVDDVKTVDKYFLTFSDEGNGCHRADFTETDSLNWVCNK